MIDVAEALRRIEKAAVVSQPRRVRIENAVGLQLREDVISDTDSPPWHRSMMDGFAVISNDFALTEDDKTVVSLDVVAEIGAGETTPIILKEGQCVRVMTGAPTPSGADAVIPIERVVTGSLDGHVGECVSLHDPHFRFGQHVSKKASFFHAGQTVIKSGVELEPVHIGLAAEVGASHVTVNAPPRVSIITTGNEIIPNCQIPGKGQIRNTNEPMLSAAVARCGAEPIPMGIARDHAESLRALMAQGLAADILLLSGGVSAGDYDLVPRTLEKMGVECIFHKVSLKPGKPIWFGIFQRPAAAPTLVFGLPGNPVSALVCFELFVRPALGLVSGQSIDKQSGSHHSAELVGSMKGGGDRPVYHPCRLELSDGRLFVEALKWGGSADLLGLSRANGLLVVPKNSGDYQEGDLVEVISLVSRFRHESE